MDNTPERKTRVLLVEDEENARTALVRILYSAGLSVVGTADGEEALSRLAEEDDFDVVLTDLTLPGISGWDVAKKVKELSPGTGVIILSGWELDDKEVKAHEGYVDGVMGKPVRVKAIVALVNELANRRGKG